MRPDGTIVIQVNRLEFGQGVQTALPMILADEMDAELSQVVAELAPAADVYKDPTRGIHRLSGFMLLLVRALDGSPSCCASG
jgi:isoquinoline 1-oxidoreductase beta subunit